MPSWKTSNIIATAAAFIFLEAAALYMVTHSGVLQKLWISSASHTVMAKLWGGTEQVKNYFALKKLNDALSEENIALNEELQRYRDAEHMMISQRMTDSLERTGDYIFTPATIVKMSRGNQHNYFIINKGYEDGIVPQSGIITGKGVIGLVDAVDRHYSFGMSLMNSNVSISARLGHDGAVGALCWDGFSTSGALLKEIPLQYKFAPGDSVWTSGYSSIFPPDIPLGIVRGSKVVNGAVNEVNVELFEDFTALRYVTVVQNAGRDEILSLEQMEGEGKN